MEKEPFFTHDKSFYRTFFRLMAIVALQNIVAYSVNMADNIMLGRYSQTALSGAATVNQIFFLVQQTTITIGDALVIIASQYWGQKRMSPIRKLTGVALKFGTICGLLILIVCVLFPNRVLSIFTADPAIITEGRAYLRIIQHTFLIFILSHVLMSALRSVEIVNISFIISVISLIIDVSINYTLIFGKFGFPELGVTGAAIGTFTARVVELLVVLWYMIFKDTRLRLFTENFFADAASLSKDYAKIAAPVMAAGLIWAVSVPMQSAVLGHLPGGVASDAIAANSVSSTFYQYLKVIVVAMASASGVMIGKAIGSGDMQRVRAEARSMSVIDVCVCVIQSDQIFKGLPIFLRFRSYKWIKKLTN